MSDRGRCSIFHTDKVVQEILLYHNVMSWHNFPWKQNKPSIFNVAVGICLSSLLVISMFLSSLETKDKSEGPKYPLDTFVNDLVQIQWWRWVAPLNI